MSHQATAAPETGERRDFLGRILYEIHHAILVWQYRISGKGKTVMLKTGEAVALKMPPRIGKTKWVTKQGLFDSRMIDRIVDRTAFGYPD